MDSNLQDKISISVAVQMTLVFVVLKIAGQIGWPWPWVLCPILIYIALTICTGIVVGFISAFADVIRKTRRH